MDKLKFLKYLLDDELSVFRVIYAAPNVLMESKVTLQKKMDYLTDVMRVTGIEVSKSTVLSYSLEDIRLRHTFLNRLGMFKPKNPKVSALQPSKNPKMSDIFDCSDRAFATKTCGVTSEEFETFRELYKREKHRNEVNFDDEEDEEEEEEEEEEEGRKWIQ